MPGPVAPFEIIGRDPRAPRRVYGEPVEWGFDTGGTVSDAVSRPDDYGFVERTALEDGTGIPGGVGGGSAYAPQVLFYVGVPDVEEALRQAEGLGGTRVLGPARAPGRDL